MSSTMPQPANKIVAAPPPRFNCSECAYKTMFESGAANHSTQTGHFITDAPPALVV
ncbi:MAG: hypothetical protein JRM77_01995 [Nitrososphaerota archaeon]|nr:hypothetical protein [Nitrososphaerota archaeon]